MDYLQFLESKRHSIGDSGIADISMPDNLFDFQSYVASYAIKKGRCAIFLDTGLGKTLIELVIAQNYIQSTNKPVLILTPLAVAFQFIKEAEKFGINDVEYSRDGKFSKKIVIANYERLHYFNTNDFECVICDESSILKNFEGAIKSHVTSFMRKCRYRFLSTATPSPNDFVELGTSSEALGYLGYTDMLTKFFTNNEDTISPMNIGTEWVLKGHAKENFFKWVSGWSISMRKPSDLGFDDSKHILPTLTINYNSIKNEKNWQVNGQEPLFAQIAKGFKEIRMENKVSVEQRCQRAIELTEPHETSVYWCNLNDEGNLLQSLDKSAHQISGSMDIDEKEEILLAFANGDIKRLITKPKITCFGLNWQHCGHTTYFPTFSYEQWYQAIRRFWRFGREGEVVADMVFSDGQKRVIDSLLAKATKADNLFSKLNTNLHNNFQTNVTPFNQKIKLPSW